VSSVSLPLLLSNNPIFISTQELNELLLTAINNTAFKQH
jgi:hypothetical protein